MKKIIAALILGIILGSMILTSCFGLFSAGVPSEDNTSTHKATPEEAVARYIEEQELDPNVPHSYLLIDKYIFLLYDDVTTGGVIDEKKGYEMYLPLGFKFKSYIPNIPENFINFVIIVKNGNDYQIEVHGFQEVGGISAIEENSPIKVYDNQGNELEKLYNKDQKDGVCVWITVLNELPKDYAIYADHNGKTYTLIDVKKIKKLVG